MNTDAVLICMVILLGLFLWAVLRLLRSRRALERERRENQQLRAMVSLGSQEVSEEMESLRKLRHDLRHYLQASGGAPSSQAEAALRRALQETEAPAPASPDWAVSALVRRYREQAEALGFQADLDLDFHTLPSRMVPDVCLVLGNLLENALEALQREGGGALRARCQAAEGYLSLVIGNTSTAPLRRVGDRYLSSKAEGRFGVGLVTVQDIARRYGGTAEFTADGAQFLAAVFLPYRPPKS